MEINMNRAERAVELKHNGCNCCQAVLLAFADQVNVDPETLRRLGAGFGIGMGNMKGTCGALIAAEMLMGLKEENRRPLIGKARVLHDAFNAKCGATICEDLKGVKTGTVLCPCDDCVRCAAELIEN